MHHLPSLNPIFPAHSSSDVWFKDVKTSIVIACLWHSAQSLMINFYSKGLKKYKKKMKSLLYSLLCFSPSFFSFWPTGGTGEKDRAPISHESFLLMANSQSDMDDWVKAIRRVIWAPFGGGKAKPLKSNMRNVIRKKRQVWPHRNGLCNANLGSEWTNYKVRHGQEVLISLIQHCFYMCLYCTVWVTNFK